MVEIESSKAADKKTSLNEKSGQEKKRDVLGQALSFRKLK